MVAQARVIATWGKNVYVKLPVTTTRGEPLFEAVRVAVARRRQDQHDRDLHRRPGRAGDGRARRAARRPACRCSPGGLPISASTIAPIMQDAVARARKTPNVEIIWASTREVFNVIEADEMGCHIITAPADVLKKLPALGTKTGAQLSLDAVKAFREDALSAGLTLAVPGASRAAE